MLIQFFLAIFILFFAATAAQAQRGGCARETLRRTGAMVGEI